MEALITLVLPDDLKLATERTMFREKTKDGVNVPSYIC